MGGPEPDRYRSEEGFLELVALDPKDGEQAVTLSCVFPRVYALIDRIGFYHIRKRDDVFAE